MPFKQPAINEHIAQSIQDHLNQGKSHPLADFGVIHEQKVQWGDMDAFAHVNNVRYYDYAQSARIHYLEQLHLFDENSYTILASSSCQYLRPVTFPDTLFIGIRCKKIGNTSLVNEYVFFSQKQQNIVATAETVIVFFDEKGENKRPITDTEKQQFMQLDSNTISHAQS